MAETGRVGRNSVTLAVGDKAPNFTLVNSADMKPVSLSDYRGKNVVLVFFPAAFSGVCTEELCSFRDLMSGFDSLGAPVIGISTDPPFAQKAFAAQNGVKFPVLSDLHNKVIEAYGLEFHNFAKVEGYTAARRSVFVLDESGTVRWSWLSEVPTNLPNYSDVEAAVKALS
jgi:peroxiredoxin